MGPVRPGSGPNAAQPDQGFIGRCSIAFASIFDRADSAPCHSRFEFPRTSREALRENRFALHMGYIHTIGRWFGSRRCFDRSGRQDVVHWGITKLQPRSAEQRSEFERPVFAAVFRMLRGIVSASFIFCMGHAPMRHCWAATQPAQGLQVSEKSKKLWKRVRICAGCHAQHCSHVEALGQWVHGVSECLAAPHVSRTSWVSDCPTA